MVVPEDIIERISQEFTLNDFDFLEGREYKEYLEKIIEDDVAFKKSAFEISDEICEKFGISENNYSLVFDLLTMEFYNGKSEAAYRLGLIKFHGMGCPEDENEAMDYFKIGAAFENDKAEEFLGVCYYNRGEYEKAFKYFSKGAFKGMFISLYMIGDMYLNGQYVEKDPNEAFKVYKECEKRFFDNREDLENGKEIFAEISLRIGKCHLYGTGTCYDYDQALMNLQYAERSLFDIVKNGKKKYRKDLTEAIDCENIARNKLFESMVEFELPF